jgi:hypothetical protein
MNRGPTKIQIGLDRRLNRLKEKALIKELMMRFIEWMNELVPQ